MPPKPEPLPPMRLRDFGASNGGKAGASPASGPHPAGSTITRRAHHVHPLMTSSVVAQGGGVEGLGIEGAGGSRRAGAYSAPSGLALADFGGVVAPAPRTMKRELGKGAAGTVLVVPRRAGGSPEQLSSGVPPPGPLTSTSSGARDRAPPPLSNAEAADTRECTAPHVASSLSVEEIFSAARKALEQPETDDEDCLRDALIALVRATTPQKQRPEDQGQEEQRDATQGGPAAFTSGETELPRFGVIACVAMREDADVSVPATLLTKVGASLLDVSFDRLTVTFPVRSESQPDAPDVEDVIQVLYSVLKGVQATGVAAGVGIAIGRSESVAIEGATPATRAYVDGTGVRDAVHGAMAAARLPAGNGGGEVIAATSTCVRVLEAFGVVTLIQQDQYGENDPATRTNACVFIEHFDAQGDREDNLP
jgi:hypothetical protein